MSESKIEQSKTLLKIGEKVRKERRKMDISQESLAIAAGVHRTYIAGIEKGKQNLSIGILKNILDVLGLSLSEFFIEFIDKKPIKPEYVKKTRVQILKK